MNLCDSLYDQALVDVGPAGSAAAWGTGQASVMAPGRSVSTIAQHNAAVAYALNIADALAHPELVYARGTLNHWYASEEYAGPDNALRGKQIPIVGVLSLPQYQPADWRQGMIAGAAASREADRRMWGQAALRVVELLGGYLLIEGAAKSTTTTVPSSGAVQAPAILSGAVYVTGPGCLSLAQERSDAANWLVSDNPDVTTAGPRVLAGAKQFETRLGAYMQAGASDPVGSFESDGANRAQAAEWAQQYQQASERATTRTWIAAGTMITAATIAGELMRRALKRRYATGYSAGYSEHVRRSFAARGLRVSG